MPTDKYDSLINSNCENAIERHNIVLKGLERDYIDVVLYLQEDERFLINVVKEDNSLLISKIKQENDIDVLNNFHSTKIDSRKNSFPTI